MLRPIGTERAPEVNVGAAAGPVPVGVPLGGKVMLALLLDDTVGTKEAEDDCTAVV